MRRTRRRRATLWLGSTPADGPGETLQELNEPAGRRLLVAARQRCRENRVTCRMGEFASAANLGCRPARRPLDTVPADPVVGLASEAPVADRRRQRDRLAVEAELPVFRREGRDHACSTSASARMNRGRVLHRDIEDAGFEVGRDPIDETMIQPLEAGHESPSLAIVFPSIV